ncbi:FAD-dependent monooxygenase [bacterium]|nr:FAD-dependent monooxygenase [bacterium]
MVPPLKIAIIGCGTAGPAAALFLHKLGHRIDLFEKTPHPSPVGAGILLQPTGQAVLKQLNLLEPIQKMGAPVTQLFGRTVTNRTIMDLDYRHLNPSWQGLGLHRGCLFQVLFDEVKKKDITVHCGSEIQLLREEASHQKSITDTQGNSYGPYDLVIICDGARSVLRHNSPLVKKAKPYPWGALWVILEDPDKLFHQTLYQVYESTTTMLGFLPTGHLPDDARQLLSLFWSIKVDTVDNFKKKDLNQWKEHVTFIEPRITPLLNQIKSHDDLLFASYMDVVMKDWTNGINTLYLGDAAHAMSPQLGQGANIALMDACVFEKCLEQSGTLTEALKQWSTYRKKHIRYYQWASRWLTPFFQSSLPLLAPLRNTFMGPLCNVKPLRHIMLASMAGIKTGIFTEQKPF